MRNIVLHTMTFLKENNTIFYYAIISIIKMYIYILIEIIFNSKQKILQVTKK